MSRLSIAYLGTQVATLGPTSSGEELTKKFPICLQRILLTVFLMRLTLIAGQAARATEYSPSPQARSRYSMPSSRQHPVSRTQCIWVEGTQQVRRRCSCNVIDNKGQVDHGNVVLRREPLFVRDALLNWFTQSLLVPAWSVTCK